VVAVRSQTGVGVGEGVDMVMVEGVRR
jgi:hypothetical protein